jgi:hypothetical protein
MRSNGELLKKADLVLSDIASAGVLNPEQSDQFIQGLIDSPTLLNSCRVVGMTSPVQDINKIGLGSRIMRAAVENTALAEGDRSKPSFSKVTLTAKEVMAEIDIPYAVMEDNIERALAATNDDPNAARGGLHSTIVNLIGARAALDLEELALLGDTSNGADAYLALFNGWLKLASVNGHTVDLSNATISKNMFKLGVQAMPDKYLRYRLAMAHYISVDQETEYRDQLSDRGTNLGDQMTTGLNPVYAFGSRVLSASMMPNSKGLFCNPLNLIFGIHRDISMEFDKDIRTRQYIIVLTTRVAVEIEEADAVVYYTNLG